MRTAAHVCLSNCLRVPAFSFRWADGRSLWFIRDRGIPFRFLMILFYHYWRVCRCSHVSFCNAAFYSLLRAFNLLFPLFHNSAARPCPFSLRTWMGCSVPVFLLHVFSARRRHLPQSGECTAAAAVLYVRGLRLFFFFLFLYLFRVVTALK